MLKTYVCQVCSHIAFNEAPVDCPVCGSAIENFENDPDAVMHPVDRDNLSEFEQKHIPVIKIDNECSINAEGRCVDVRVSVGKIRHEMESEHFIDCIDLYLDKKFTSRVEFTAKRLYPSVHLCLNTASGVLSVIAHCNVHGNWRSKEKLDEA